MKEIQLHNDGKQKYQSFEASLVNDVEYDLTGYGADKEEAIEELKRKVNKRIKYLKNIDYKAIELVDCFGKPLK